MILFVKPGDVFGREMRNLGALSFGSCIRAGDADHRYGSGGGSVLWPLLTWHPTRLMSGVVMAAPPWQCALPLRGSALVPGPLSMLGTARGITDWDLACLKANCN